MPHPAPQIAKVKNVWLKYKLELHAKKYHQTDIWDFYHSKKTNQVIYETYIRVGAPKDIDLEDGLRTALHKLAAARTYDKMTTQLKSAKQNAMLIIDRDVCNAFSHLPEGQVALAVAGMGLDTGKAIKAEPFVQMCVRGRTEADKWEAYLALAKIAGTGKVAASFATMGKPVPTRPLLTEAQMVAGNKTALETKRKLTAALTKLQTSIPKANKALAAAIATVKNPLKGVPSDKDKVNKMFDQGRQFSDSVSVPWAECLQLDHDIAKKQPAVARGAEAVSELWQEYRRLLGRPG